MHKISLLTFLLSAIVLCLATQRCSPDKLFTEGDVLLRVEMDTLRFDTVFTTVGTVTRSVKVYNDYDERILLSDITILNPASRFRINVQGFTATPIKDIIIQPQDSIYIFVEATINPDEPVSVSPFILEDAIELSANGSKKLIYLEAFGQNANYIPSNSSDGEFSYVSCNFGDWVWDDPKPYVLYGALLIDSCSLILPQGCRVYVHGGIANNDFGLYNDGLLIIGGSGQLLSEGTVDNPVLIQSDRLEESYQDDRGQWAGILLASKRANKLDYTKILHSIVGIRVDSASNVALNSVEVGLNSANAILGVHSTITAKNCLFHSSNSHGINLLHGGNYNFEYCTAYNSSSQTHALNMTNYKCLDQLCFEAIKNPVNGVFRNCIFSGFNSDEIWLDDIDAELGDFNYFFDHCAIRVDELLDANAFPNFFENCSGCLQLANQDSLYMSIDSLDFRLDTMSVVIDKAKFVELTQIDIIGWPREQSMPDIGCYEFQK